MVAKREIKSLSSLNTITWVTLCRTRSAMAWVAMAISAEFFDDAMLKCWIPWTITFNSGKRLVARSFRGSTWVVRTQRDGPVSPGPYPSNFRSNSGPWPDPQRAGFPRPRRGRRIRPAFRRHPKRPSPQAIAVPSEHDTRQVGWKYYSRPVAERVDRAEVIGRTRSQPGGNRGSQNYGHGSNTVWGCAAANCIAPS